MGFENDVSHVLRSSANGPMSVYLFDRDAVESARLASRLARFAAWLCLSEPPVQVLTAGVCCCVPHLQAGDLEAALSQTGGNVAESAGLLAEGFTASSSDTSKDTVQSGSATREKDDADSNDSKIEYLMQLHDGVDRSLAHAALDAVDGDLQLAAEDLLDGGHWVTNDVTDDDVTLLLDMGITTNLDLAKHALEKADRDVDQAAELILGGLLLPSNGRSSKHVEKRNAERITAAPRNQFHSTEGNPSSSSEDESEIDEAQKVTRRGKTLKKPASGKAGKPDCQSGDYENDEELRDDEPLDSSDEDGYLAEALQLSIEELVDGEIDMEEDAKTTREISLRWQELANVQVTLRMFGHELSSCELEKLQTEQDGLRDFLGLDPLPRRPQHQAKSTLPGESGKGHRPGEKGKKKDTGGSGNTRHSGSPEKRNELTEAEEQTMVQVVQSFELTIEEVFHVQTQRKQTTGNAFTDAAGLVDAVLSYMTTMEDAELARVLHADDVTPEQPQQQRRRRQDAGINDDSGESESSDEGGRIRNRQDRVKNKRDDQRYRLPGAAAFKEHGGGALLRSVEHEQFYETIEADDWQIAMKKKAVKHRKKLESMQHKSIKQNNERAAGLNQGRQQKRPSRRTKPEQHAAVFSESEWEADDWVSESGLLIPPPPSQPHHPSSTEAILLQKNAELQRQIAEMRRSQQQTLEQKMEALWQQAHQLPTSQSVAGASSWADMAKKDTMADPNLIFGGAGVPPRNIQEDVHWWPFLQRYIIESLITTGKTKWEEITPIVAKSLQGTSSLQGLLPLERFLHERWSWLPPQPHRHKFVFTASVALLKNGKLKWELRWPELVSRRESLGKSGFTKRIYEYYGHENLLFVDIPSGVHGVEVAKRLRQCTPAGGWKIKMLGQRWSLLEVRPESGSKKPQMVLTCATDKLRNDAGVYDTWHFDPCANKEISIAKSLARSNMGMSSVITTVVLSSDRILPCQDGLGDFADGACGISESLFAMVWEQYCEQTFTEDAGVIPSTFQGRIGSKKGVWYIDDRIADGCVEFRSNQQKWYIPSPTDEQLTIEICCFGVDSGPARLNLQMIRLLELRMQSTTTNPRGPLLLADLLIDQLENDAKALTDFEACERFCRDGGDKGEAILEKLRSGWRLEDEIVQSLLRKSMVARHRKCVDENKLHIKLKKSRDYIIVPDPFGILEPHEVVVKVPGIGYLQEPCIIGRSPCYHPGELLTVEAVHIIDLISRCNQDGRNKNWKSTFEWFERQQCVVILSSKPVGQAFAGTHGHTQNWDPNRGVADLMQGGDYDGDNVKVIWDERFVVDFKPWEPIVYTPPQKHRLGSMKIGELPAGISVDDVAFEYFLEVVRNSEMSPVGLISTLHENWSLEAAGDWNSAAGENCESLADLAQKALDAVSTGYEIVVPQQLKNVERSSYRRRSSPDAGIVRASDDPDMFTVCVVGLEETVKADTLEEALKVAYNLVCLPCYCAALPVRAVHLLEFKCLCNLWKVTSHAYL